MQRLGISGILTKSICRHTFPQQRLLPFSTYRILRAAEGQSQPPPIDPKDQQILDLTVSSPPIFLTHAGKIRKITS